MKENRKVYDGKSGKWELTNTCENAKEVYEYLSQDLIHKQLHKCKYITRITDTCLYNGFREITVYYNNKVKAIYVVKA